MSVSRSAPSNSSVERAGVVLRRYQRGELVAPDAHASAVAVLFDWRSGFSEPLTKTVMGVRSFLTTTTGLEPHGRVGQRLKRHDRIVDKLVRMATLRLPQMEDVAGCRVVLDDSGQLRRLEEHLVSQWSIRGTDDYVARPKETGYRAVHLIVERDGRQVEVQLRMRAHHAWAQLVDEIALLGGVFGRIKDGIGPDEVLEPLREVAEALNEMSENAPVDATMNALLDRLDQAIASLTDNR